MKKITTILFITITLQFSLAQKQTNDTIKTEVIEVISSYTPKLSDAYKIKQKPIIQLRSNNAKKKLSYIIKSFPVASTFIPKSGALKPIKIKKRELVYNNYISAGFGNTITPEFELYFLNNKLFKHEYGVNAQFKMSVNPVRETKLNSTYYDMDINAFYKKHESYYNWKLAVDASRNLYNWFGLPDNITFKKDSLKKIDPKHVFSSYTISNEFNFTDSFLKQNELSINYFSDNYKTAEIRVRNNLKTTFELSQFKQELNNLNLNVYIDFLSTTFKNNYQNTQSKKHRFFSAGIHPFYKINLADFEIKLGGKGYISMNIENNKNNFVLYPDFSISYPLISKDLTLYAGITGDLKTYSYNDFSKENPFISPTVTLARSSEVNHFFGGFKGSLLNKINYNISGNYLERQNQPFYIIHQSKSDGFRFRGLKNTIFKGYEFGNSFEILYDHINLTSIDAEIEYEFSPAVKLGVSGNYSNYKNKNFKAPYHLPTFKSHFFGKYKQQKWYTGLDLFFVGERKGLIRESNYYKEQTLNSYIDLNINGGYHLNRLVSFYIKGNNLMNTNYQRYTQYDAHGIQIIGGVIWKFDRLF